MAENQVVIFELAGVRYGINILQVQEIMRLVEITPVAGADMSVEGIINLRGHVIPVISLSRRLGISEMERNRESRIIVVESNGKRIGLIVDQVLEVGTFTGEEMENPSGVCAGTAFLKGIVKKKDHLWLVLNLAEVA